LLDQILQEEPTANRFPGKYGATAPPEASMTVSVNALCAGGNAANWAQAAMRTISTMMNRFSL
jgi:hypothetical protein